MSGLIADSQIPNGITRDTELTAKADTDLGNVDSNLSNTEQGLIRSKIGAGTASSYSDLGQIPVGNIPSAIARVSNIGNKVNTDFSNVSAIPDGKLPSTITRDTELEAVRSTLQGGINTVVSALNQRMTTNFSNASGRLTEDHIDNAITRDTELQAGLRGKADTSNLNTLAGRVTQNETAIAGKANTNFANVANGAIPAAKVSSDIARTSALAGKADTNLQNIPTTLTAAQQENVRTRIGAVNAAAPTRQSLLSTLGITENRKRIAGG